MIQRMQRVAVLALIMCGAAGCTDPDGAPAGASVTIDTIDGVAHVVSSGAGAWAGGEGWSVAVDSGVVIGESEGPEPLTFGQVSGVVVGEDGRIYVGDTQAMEVRVFSPEGEFLSRFGGEGEGPGEFTNISGLARAPDGIAVLDGDQGRLSVFSPSGELVRSFSLERPYRIHEYLATMRFDDEGRFYDRARLSMAPMVDSIGVIVYSPAGEPVDTVHVATIQQDHLVVERGGVPRMSFPRPFSPRPALAVGPAGRIHFTRGGEYRILVRSPAGDTLRILRRPVEPATVGAAERDSAFAMIDELYRQAAGTPAPRGIELPETKPMIAMLEVDRTGHVWAASAPSAESTRSEWAVHDPAGRYLGSVAMPVMAVADIGEDYVAGVQSDDLGVQRVAVYPLRRGR